MRIRTVLGALAIAATAVGVPAFAASAAPRGPEDLQRHAVTQSIWWSDNLRTDHAGQLRTSPLACDDAQPVGSPYFYLPVNAGPFLKGDPLNVHVECTVGRGQPLVLDLGGSIVSEDNNFDSEDPNTYWLIGEQKVSFAAENLERICDNMVETNVGGFSASTAELDRRPISKTLVQTNVFDAAPKPGNFLGWYEESSDLGHAGHLAAVYCGYKAVIGGLSWGNYRLVLTVGGSGRTITYNLHVR